MNKKVLLVVGAVLAAVLVFAAGAVAGPRLLRFLPGGGAMMVAVGPAGITGVPGGAGGPMASLSADERAQLQNMSDSERQAFMQEKFGAQAPGESRRRGPGSGALVIEGEVLSVDAETIGIKTAAGGSQTVYADADTTYAYAKGAEQAAPAVGDTVTVVASPESDNVLSASVVVLQ